MGRATREAHTDPREAGVIRSSGLCLPLSLLCLPFVTGIKCKFLAVVYRALVSQFYLLNHTSCVAPFIFITFVKGSCGLQHCTALENTNYFLCVLTHGIPVNCAAWQPWVGSTVG